MRQWLLSVVGAAMLSSLALALCPKGRVRPVTRFVCALGCMLTLMGPLVELDGESLLPQWDDYRAEADALTQTERETAKQEQRIYIQEQCAAYILTEAQALNASVSGASVLARWDAESESWLPAYATVTGPYSAALAEAIEQSLGIAKEAQRWRE